MNLREVAMKYGRLVVFIRRDPADIWGFRCRLSLGIDTLKFMASAGVFVLVVC
jgi:predicted methyltransferase